MMKELIVITSYTKTVTITELVMTIFVLKRVQFFTAFYY